MPDFLERASMRARTGEARVDLSGQRVDDFDLCGAQRIVEEPALRGGQAPRREGLLDLLHRQLPLPNPLREEALSSEVAPTDFPIHDHTSNPRLRDSRYERAASSGIGRLSSLFTVY